LEALPSLKHLELFIAPRVGEPKKKGLKEALMHVVVYHLSAAV
jgi:hypothetical protein